MVTYWTAVFQSMMMNRVWPKRTLKVLVWKEGYWPRRDEYDVIVIVSRVLVPHQHVFCVSVYASPEHSSNIARTLPEIRPHLDYLLQLLSKNPTPFWNKPPYCLRPMSSEPSLSVSHFILPMQWLKVSFGIRSQQWSGLAPLKLPVPNTQHCKRQFADAEIFDYTRLSGKSPTK